jgi:GNAT superfamily N-acetyltransferase
MAEVGVRRAVDTDASAVADLWLRSRVASVPAIPPPVHSDIEVRRWFAEVVIPTHEAWVAELSTEDIVAVLVLGDDSIDQLYVDPSWTGAGIGSQLLALAKIRRPHRLNLWTFQANHRARRFYDRHGFVAVDATEGSNEEGAPDVRYDWRPAPQDDKEIRS